MKLDINRIKMNHGILLPENEPYIPQNTQRRQDASAQRSVYEQKITEQTIFEYDLGHSTGRLDEILNPRVIAPTNPGRAGAPNVIEQQNMYAGHLWPTKTAWGDPLRSGMKISALEYQKFRDTFAHLGMIPGSYSVMFNQMGQHEQFILNNNKAPSRLFSNTLKKAEWVATLNLALDEARTSYAHHINRQNDEAQIYLHLDFVYRDNVSSDQDIRFTFPQNEEQKAIWRDVFWGEPLPQFPIIPEAFAVPKSPSLTSGSSSAGIRRQSGNLLANELGRLQIQPQKSARGGAPKDPFFM